ncbi:CHAD domain-containing protein [Pelolinea submarina]|uniref:CHAD domain-containing protein n=2 Tax=Pelolinea submarina TaxID=913107 RepID=A0A3E0AI68_9CHLR|nr:CHAD domain-containing protein [Pelolinea submarina]
MLPGLEALRKKAHNIQHRQDIEDIHDLRVASRRIRTCLDIFSDSLPSKKTKIWVRDIREITKSYGQVRDLDVQIDLLNQIYKSVDDSNLQSGLRRVRLRLKQKRRVKDANTQKISRGLMENTSLLEMDSWAKAILEIEPEVPQTHGPLFQLGYEHVQNRLDEFLFYEVFIFDPTRVEELHQMRIAAKRLRYALEVFSLLYKGKSDFALEITRQTQQFLGEIHDADVWISYLPAFMEKEQQRVLDFYGYKSPFNRLKPGIEFLLENRRQERLRLYDEFLEAWKNWKLKETWLNLRKVIFLTNLEEQQRDAAVSSVLPPAEDKS